MNKNQASGAAKDVGGKVQEHVGKLVGSKQQEVKGIKHQIDGKLQETVGDLQQSVKNLKKNK